MKLEFFSGMLLVICENYLLIGIFLYIVCCLGNRLYMTAILHTKVEITFNPLPTDIEFTAHQTLHVISWQNLL